MTNLPFGWFTDMGFKHFNHIVERKLVSSKFVDFNFIRHAKFSFIEKLERLGVYGSF